MTAHADVIRAACEDVGCQQLRSHVDFGPLLALEDAIALQLAELAADGELGTPSELARVSRQARELLTRAFGKALRLERVATQLELDFGVGVDFADARGRLERGVS